MGKEQRKIIFTLAGQILPFVVITTTFVCIARVSCHSFMPFTMEGAGALTTTDYEC